MTSARLTNAFTTRAIRKPESDGILYGVVQAWHFRIKNEDSTRPQNSINRFKIECAALNKFNTAQSFSFSLYRSTLPRIPLLCLLPFPEVSTHAEAFSRSPYSDPSFFKECGPSMYTLRTAVFIFRKHSCGLNISGQQSPCFHIAVPLGSLFRWLFLHRRLRFRQRGLGLLPSDMGTSWIDPFQRALHVFIHAIQVFPKKNPSQAFRLRSKAYQQFKSAFLASETVRHRLRFLFLQPVKRP